MTHSVEISDAEASADLLDLAARCEAAVGPDHRLDAAVWKAALAEPGQLESIAIGREVYGDKEAQFRTDRMMDGFRPTASLDAAMTLVPEGHHWQVGEGIETEAGIRDRAYAWCTDADEGELSLAATPALALTAACLRARAGEQ